MSERDQQSNDKERDPVKPIEYVDEALAAIPTKEEIDQFCFHSTPPRWINFALEWRFKLKELAAAGLSTSRSAGMRLDDKVFRFGADRYEGEQAINEHCVRASDYDKLLDILNSYVGTYTREKERAEKAEALLNAQSARTRPSQEAINEHGVHVAEVLARREEFADCGACTGAHQLVGCKYPNCKRSARYVG